MKNLKIASCLIFSICYLLTPDSLEAATPASTAVMVNPNGVLLAPANFWQTNASNINASVKGINLIPPVASYSTTTDPNATANFGENIYYYWVTLNTNLTYWVIVPGQGNGAEQGIASDTNNQSDLIQTDGFFHPTNAVCELYSSTSGTAIGTQVYLTYSNINGNLGGTFDGTLTTNSTVPASTLPNTVLQAGNQIHGGQLWCPATNSYEHYIAQNGSGNGSTLSLLKADTRGYCDINFYSVNATSIPSLVGLPSSYLRFAIGCGVPGANQFPYNQPYIESYTDQYPVYYVGSGHIFGGFSNAPNSLGDWVWFRTATNDVMMRTSTEDSANEFFYPVIVKSNLYTANLTVTNAATIGAAQILSGTGSPQSVVTAPPGSIFLRTDGGSGTTLYVKESGSGNTGWVAK
jgi:hypothetical protein